MDLALRFWTGCENANNTSAGARKGINFNQVRHVVHTNEASNAHRRAFAGHPEQDGCASCDPEQAAAFNGLLPETRHSAPSPLLPLGSQPP